MESLTIESGSYDAVIEPYPGQTTYIRIRFPYDLDETVHDSITSMLDNSLLRVLTHNTTNYMVVDIDFYKDHNEAIGNIVKALEVHEITDIRIDGNYQPIGDVSEDVWISNADVPFTAADKCIGCGLTGNIGLAIAFIALGLSLYALFSGYAGAWFKLLRSKRK